MIEIINKINCCGCTSCAMACSKKAIKMKPDTEGFLYPEVNLSQCIQCGTCQRVCPVEIKPTAAGFHRESCVLRVKNSFILENSTSGGFVTPLINWILEQDGSVCAATYGRDFKIEHTIIHGDSELVREEISRIRGSKYVQSDMGDCYATIKRSLDKGELVCFVGTTCQVNGLKAFLRKEYERLICVDLVCHGVPSPKLWKKYLEYQQKHNGEIDQISFRNKTYGYHSGTMKIRFASGETYYGSARVDLMLKSFFSEIASRPICYQCPFKTIERCSDFTIYDCWHAAELVPDLMDDDCGYTNVIVQSQKGKQILEQISDCYDMHSVDTDEAIKLDGSMVLRSAVPHIRRTDFYRGLDETPLEEHIQSFIPITVKDSLIEKSKRLLYQIGIYKGLKQLLKQ